MEYILLSVFIVAVIAIYLVYKIPSDDKFDKIILFFLFIAVFHVLYIFACQFFALPKYIDSAFPFGLLYGPILYFALKVVAGKIVLIKKAMLHFIPFFLGIICFLIFVFFSHYRAHNYEIYHILLYSLISISMISYVVVAFYNKTRIQSKSSHNAVRLITVGVVIFATLGLLILTLTLNRIISKVTDNTHFPRVLCYTAMLIQVGAVFRYQVQRLVEISDIQNNPKENTSIFQEQGSSLYQKSLITDSRMDFYEKRLMKLIKDDKVFQNMELSLEVLAKQIGAPKHHLTQLFNIRMKKTFTRYINELRIEYACKILEQNPKEYSIEELAYECGFKSKVSFNRNFKNVTGITPSQYRGNP